MEKSYPQGKSPANTLLQMNAQLEEDIVAQANNGSMGRISPWLLSQLALCDPGVQSLLVTGTASLLNAGPLAVLFSSFGVLVLWAKSQ